MYGERQQSPRGAKGDQKLVNSNTIVNSFINGNFGYNYYLSNNKAQLDKEGSDDGNKTIRNENDDMSEEKVKRIY